MSGLFEDLPTPSQAAMSGMREVQNDPNAGVDFGSRWAVARNDDNPAVQRQLIAEHYGIDPSDVQVDPVHGFIVRDGDKWVRALPTGQGDFFLSNDTQQGIAQFYSKPGAMIGATVGSFFGPGTAVAGAATGDLAQSAYEEYVEGNERSLGDYASSAGAEAATQFVGDKAFNIAGKWLSMGKDKFVDHFSSSKYSYTPDQVNKAWENIQKAANIKDSKGNPIRLTVAEAFESPDMLQVQHWLKGQHNEASQIINEHIKARYPVLNDVLDEFTGKQYPVEAYKRNIEAIRQRQSDYKQLRSDVSEEHYRAGFNNVADITPVLDSLANRIDALQNTKLGNKLKSINKALFRLDGDEKVPKSMVGHLHDVKMDIDDAIEVAKRAGNNNQVRELMMVKENLLEAMTSASPSYKQGKDLYEEMSFPLNEMDDNVHGELLRMAEKQKSMAKVGRYLFGPESSPEMVAFARASINNDELFQDMTMAYLKETLYKLKHLGANNETFNVGGRWAAEVWGRPSSRKLLETALSPEQYKAVEDMAYLMRLTGGSFKGNSNTAMFQTMNEQAKGNRSVQPWKWGNVLDKAYEDWNFDTVTKNLANTLTNPASRKQLAEAAMEIRKFAAIGTPEAEKQMNERLKRIIKTLSVQTSFQPLKEKYTD
jgi:hypothetical protein